MYQGEGKVGGLLNEAEHFVDGMGEVIGDA